MWFIPSHVLYRLAFLENRGGLRLNLDRVAARIELQGILGHPSAFWQIDFQEGSRSAIPVPLQVKRRSLSLSL
jgi:hypothetical protein